MQEIIGNLMTLFEDGEWIAVPTNGIVSPRGEAVMGSGVAFQIAQRVPNLQRDLGAWINTFGNKLGVFPQHSLITVPTKDAWWDPSPIELVERSVKQLVKTGAMMRYPGHIYLPRIGCGCGQLDWIAQVRPLLERHLDDKFVVVSFRE